LKTTTFKDAVNEALIASMNKNENVIFYGLGADDPKRIFGTSANLTEKFGNDRVFDMPTAENAMTGIAIGAAINGIIPVMCHQRFDFFFLALDQLINNAAKWSYMFGGKNHVPITIRLIIGRGWGNGPTHTQNLQSIFHQVPGLKVVSPTTPKDAKGLLLSSVFDPDPVVFIEHRWLHQQVGPVDGDEAYIPIGKANLVQKGKDITIVSHATMTLEAIRAIQSIESSGIGVDLIDLRTIHPVDFDSIYKSVRKTGKLLCLDTSFASGSTSSHIISKVSQDCFDSLKCAPELIALPDYPVPTSPALTEDFYPTAHDIVDKIKMMTGKNFNIDLAKLKSSSPHDVPGDWFKGPF
jgi:pyruvate dehydrogenase E1 component beta subunit